MGKNKQHRSGKDKITGLSVTFSDIGTIKSDVVYGIDSKAGKFFADRAGDTISGQKVVDLKVEFEFDKNFFVATFLVSYDKPDARGRDQEVLTRIAETGSYSYRNGRLEKATVQGLGQRWPDGIGTGGITYADPGGGVVVNDTSSYTSYIYGIEPIATVANKTHGYLDFGMDGSNDDEIVGLGESGVRSFGGGKIFYKGWEANPFASNLI